MSKVKNYYQVLGVDNFASEEAVKTAFRKLVRQHHPDVNPDKNAEETFKQINEAYEILNSPEKRAIFNESLQRTLKKDAPPPTPTPPPAAKAKPKPEHKPDIFETFKKGFASSKDFSKDDKKDKDDRIFTAHKEQEKAKPNHQQHPKRGQDAAVETSITPQEAEHGVVKTVNVQHNEVCRRCSGTGKVSGARCTSCQGDKVLVRHKKIDVRIPAGVKNGSKVRVAGEGGRGTDGGDAGDLFLQIKIVLDASLRIEGLDVYSEVPVSMPDAVLGKMIDVATVHGSVSLTIPPHTSSGRVLRLKGHGVEAAGTRGDHYVSVKIVSPDNLSPRERELYQELARLQKS